MQPINSSAIAVFIPNPPVPESALLRDLIFVFQGIDGQHIKFDDATNEYVLDASRVGHRVLVFMHVHILISPKRHRATFFSRPRTLCCGLLNWDGCTGECRCLCTRDTMTLLSVWSDRYSYPHLSGWDDNSLSDSHSALRSNAS